MTILVTGSAGHLGEALVRTLRIRGVAVRGTDRLASPFTEAVGDLAARPFVRECLRDVTAVLHAATLHKPHVGTHSWQQFVDTNIVGTLNLLEESVAAGVRAFVYTSTTSAFGDSLVPPPGAPAAWITEDVPAQAKNIYGATKTAAEDLCALAHRQYRLPCVVLRTSRFFPEPDDAPARRDAYADENLKINELLYRRADIVDVVDAHLAAMARAPALGFGRYIVSATTPFSRDDLPALRHDAPSVVAKYVPSYRELYEQRGWRMLTEIDRVYVNDRARADLGWKPRYDFAHAIAALRKGEDWRSPLTHVIGIKGYHAGEYADGLYPTGTRRAPP